MLKKCQLNSYLKNNSGDIYINFLMFFLCFILLFSAIFSFMQLRIATNNIYNEIETSADIVLATIKKECYQTLIDGTTENSNISSVNTEDIAIRLSDQLNAEYASNQIKKTVNGSPLFIISNINLSYDDLSEKNASSDIDNGLLKLRFNIEIPAKFNGNIIYTINKTYTKNTTLNFK